MTLDDTHYSVALDGGREVFTIEKKYKIIRKIGSGSYGTVCSAIDLSTNTVVAIKKCFHIFDKKLITKRCLREIKLLQHFNGHARIINLRAMDIADYHDFNEVYLVQDCCDTTMADIIHSHTELEPVHYQWFMYQLFTALKFIHSANVLHRDLKPANILVNQDCSIRVCDFGMARGFAEGTSEVDGMNMTHYVVTRWYRAPEVMLNPNHYGKAIDLWSVGCIFAELLGRKVLFKGSDYVDQLHRIVGILGLPEDTSFWETDAAEFVMDYIKSLRDGNGEPPPREPIDFVGLFPCCSAEGIDLLMKLLNLNPHERMTADDGLEHGFVAQMRDRAEEADCPELFDFGSFEHIQEEEGLLKCIVHEVLCSKGDDQRRLGIRKGAGWDDDDDESQRQACLQDQDEDSAGTPERRYTGSTISTPHSASATDARLHAMAAVQEGLDIELMEDTTTQGMILDNFVGEPEDMDEDDFKLVDSHDGIRVEYRRQLVGPSSADYQALERHLSREW